MKQKEPQQLLDRESLKNLTPEQRVERVLKLQELTPCATIFSVLIYKVFRNQQR